MPEFISCDWGTSVLRLRVADTETMKVFAEVISPDGISATFELWKQSGKKENERLLFYQSILSQQIKKLEEQLHLSLQDLPLIISGMASSNIGMLEIPYKEVPFSSGGHDLTIETIEAKQDFKHNILIISGAKTATDVMRGEETQLAGCLDNNTESDQLFIFPGTHSKHVFVKNGKAEDFKTYMTGEFFELLSKKSILSNVVEKSMGLMQDNTLTSFEKGVEDALHSNILNTSFLVRTNYLFKKLPKAENYYYLSGLLIGTELKELRGSNICVTVVSDEPMSTLYISALRKIGISNVQHQSANKAIIGGHAKIYHLHKSKVNADFS